MDQLKSFTKPLPLCFAAPVNWYAEMIMSEKLCLAEEQYFEKQTFRNRFYYGSFQGKRFFTIPLLNNSLGGDYGKVKIDYAQHWQNQLINAVRTSYGKSPFYEFYGYRFEKIIAERFEFLWDLNIGILEETLKCLKVDKNIELKKVRITDYELVSGHREYYQVFHERVGFLPDLSILDLLYNEGPDAALILINLNQK